MYTPLVLILTVAGIIGLSTLVYEIASFYSTKIPQWHSTLVLYLMPMPQTITVAMLEIKKYINDAYDYIHVLEYIKQSSTVQGVLICIDSEGGAAGVDELLHYEIKELAKTKPVVVFIDKECLSAAYIVASAANYIIATRSANVGSVGTYTQVIYYDGNVEGSLGGDMRGSVKSEYIAGGAYKTIGFKFRPLSESDRAYMQRHANALYDIVCELIAQARNLAIEQRDIWADGKEFTGQEARDLGLIDACGSWTDAKNVMHKLIVQRVPNIRGSLNVVSVDTLFK